MKRFLCVVLTLILAFSVCSVTALAGGDLPFTDVRTTDWFYSAVEYVYDWGLMGGTGDATFSPNLTTTRGMIVTILHRMEYTPYAEGQMFTDVPAGQYYTDAVAWASANGIVGGYGDGRFGPNDPITREQLAAILYRYAQYNGQDLSAEGSVYAFSDGGKVSSYAIPAMNWAIGKGLLSGVDEYRLNPTGYAVRAQVAAVLMRMREGTSGEQMPGETTEGSDDQTVTVENANFYVDGKGYGLGMSASGLPQEDERLSSTYGFTWYVFGTNTYQNFFAAGVDNGRVVALAASGPSFTWEGYSCGDVLPEHMMAAGETDPNDGNILHAVLLLEDGWRTSVTDADALAGESKLNFHFVNGFRAYHGKGLLKWSQQAETAALLHSRDMAEQDYFSHNSLDGTEPGRRMTAQGIRCSTWGENIAAGYQTGFIAYCGWVESAGHRSNMLKNDFMYLGVGMAHSSNSIYSWMMTQDFYA